MLQAISMQAAGLLMLYFAGRAGSTHEGDCDSYAIGSGPEDEMERHAPIDKSGAFAMSVHRCSLIASVVTDSIVL